MKYIDGLLILGLSLYIIFLLTACSPLKDICFQETPELFKERVNDTTLKYYRTGNLIYKECPTAFDKRVCSWTEYGENKTKVCDNGYHCYLNKDKGTVVPVCRK